MMSLGKFEIVLNNDTGIEVRNVLHANHFIWLF